MGFKLRQLILKEVAFFCCDTLKQFAIFLSLLLFNKNLYFWRLKEDWNEFKICFWKIKKARFKNIFNKNSLIFRVLLGFLKQKNNND